MNVFPNDPSWTLDQLLLWVGTGDMELVNDASPNLPRPSSWLETLLGSPPLKPPFVRPADVEQEVMRLLRWGEIDARRDLEIIPSVWFHEATMLHVGEVMLFRRRPLHGVVCGQLEMRPPEDMNPRFDALAAIAATSSHDEVRSPAELSVSLSDEITYASGSPGRPTSKHIWMAEAVSRIETCDELPGTLAEFATTIAQWFEAEHPKAARVTAKTIRNNAELSRRFRTAKMRMADPKTQPETSPRNK